MREEEKRAKRDPREPGDMDEVTGLNRKKKPRKGKLSAWVGEI